MGASVELADNTNCTHESQVNQSTQ